MVYLVIKELSSIADDVLIVTSSLQKDMNAKNELQLYRANAVRALCKITDVHNLFIFIFILFSFFIFHFSFFIFIY